MRLFRRSLQWQHQHDDLVDHRRHTDTVRHRKLTGYYRYTKAGSDTASIVVGLYKYDTGYEYPQDRCSRYAEDRRIHERHRLRFL